MGRFFIAAGRAFGSLTQSGLFKAFLMSISINIVILMLLVWGIYALLDWVTVFESETADFLLDIAPSISVFCCHL